MTYKRPHNKPTKIQIDKYLMILDFAKKNDYKLTINKHNNLKTENMETNKLNKGYLFKNDNKKNENHPDYNGKIVLANNKEYYLSAWVNTSKNGNKYLSINIGNETTPAPAPAPAKKVANYDDDLPF